MLRLVPVAATVALLTLGAITATELEAQSSPLLLELSGGAAIPLGDLADGSEPGEGATAGASLTVHFTLPGAGRRGLYVGFSQHRFGCEDAGCAEGGRYVATGFDAGLRFRLAEAGPAVPWLRVGAITTRVETDDLGGANAGVSELGFGGEVGVGVHIGADSPLAVSPSVRYALIGTTLPGGATLDMTYLVAQLAIVLAF